MTPKIATCCYCGTRAALILRGKERHELACSTCGAPLHEMKMLRDLTLGRNITDVGLQWPKEVKSLQRLSLIHSDVTDAGVGDLKKAIPGLRPYHSRPDNRIPRRPIAPKKPGQLRPGGEPIT